MRRTSCVYTRQSWFPCVDGQASGGWDWVSPDNPSYLWSLTNTGPASTLQSTDHPSLSLSLSYNYYGNILALMLLRSLTLCDTAWHSSPGRVQTATELSPGLLQTDWLTGAGRRAECWHTDPALLSPPLAGTLNNIFYQQAALLNISGKIGGKSLEYFPPTDTENGAALPQLTPFVRFLS